MAFYSFLWDEENEEHLAEHDVTPDEFTEVVQDPDGVRMSRSTGRPIAFGYTSGGRYLACVYEVVDDITIRPITAYDVEP